MKVSAYIDGFNLYYGALRRSNYKWLDVSELVKSYLPEGAVVGSIKYFTARVSAWAYDPGQPARQDIYLRALRTIPNLEVIEGSFLVKPKWLPAATLDARQQRVAVSFLGIPLRLPLVKRAAHKKPLMIRVLRSEEKGSDVNLASHLLNDAHLGAFEEALVVTNDADLCEPIRIATKELGLPVRLLSPYSYYNPPLKALVDSARRNLITPEIIEKSQFAATLKDANGEFRKPAEWMGQDRFYDKRLKQ